MFRIGEGVNCTWICLIPPLCVFPPVCVRRDVGKYISPSAVKELASSCAFITHKQIIVHPCEDMISSKSGAFVSTFALQFIVGDHL